MSIKLNNKSGIDLDIAISVWERGSASFYPIDNNSSDSWGRTDERGCIVVMTRRGEDRRQGTYWFVRANREYDITPTAQSVFTSQVSMPEIKDALNFLQNPYG